MMAINATDVRKNWSEVSDSVIREKPKFIKKARDYMLLSNIEFIANLLSGYEFTAKKYIEDDGSVTLFLNEIPLVENAATEEEAIEVLANSILEYAVEFYDNFNLWASAPNKKREIPYVFKALILDDISKIGAVIKCQAGEIWNDFAKWMVIIWKYWSLFFRKIDENGNLRFTKVSRGTGEIKGFLWKEIFKKQLGVTEEYFNTKL